MLNSPWVEYTDLGTKKVEVKVNFIIIAPRDPLLLPVMGGFVLPITLNLG